MKRPDNYVPAPGPLIQVVSDSECVIEFERCWCSKKNETRVHRRGKSARFRVGRSETLRNDEAYVRARIAEALRHRHDLPLFGDHEVEVRLLWHVPSDHVIAEVLDLGPRAEGRIGRNRDVTNLGELFLDCAEELIYRNDNQVRTLTVSRTTT